MYCTICSKPAQTGIVCDDHKDIWNAIHEIANREDVTSVLSEALAKVPHLYDPKTSEKYTDAKIA